MFVVQETVNSKEDHGLDYEKDPRFVRYMEMRLEKAVEAREAGRLVDAAVVFSNIRDRYRCFWPLTHCTPYVQRQ
jgi:hypothetical protein